MVRRGRDKVADSFLAKTKNKEVLRIKPLIITSNKGTKALQSAMRLEARRVIREFAFTKDTKDVFAEIVDGKLQKKIKEAVAKLAPVRSSEIRMAKIDENTNVVVTEGAVKTEKVTIRQKDKGNQFDKPKVAKEKTQAEEYEESLASSGEEIVADENEFETEKTVEEDLTDATQEELDEEPSQVVEEVPETESEIVEAQSCEATGAQEREVLREVEKPKAKKAE